MWPTIPVHEIAAPGVTGDGVVGASVVSGGMEGAVMPITRRTDAGGEGWRRDSARGHALNPGLSPSGHVDNGEGDRNVHAYGHVLPPCPGVIGGYADFETDGGGI